MFKSVLATTALAFSAFSAHAVTIVAWDFEGFTAPAATATITGVSPATGSGSAAGVHAASSTWSTPAGNGSAKSLSSNTWAVGDYWQFAFSTVGFSGIGITFDQTGSGTGPREFKLAYSTNSGSSFTDFQSYSLSAVTWSSGTANGNSTFSFNLSGITGLNNNAGVVIRLIDTSTTSIGGTTPVATAGTDRVDNFVVSTVPEASTTAMLAAGLLALSFVAARRRG